MTICGKQYLTEFYVSEFRFVMKNEYEEETYLDNYINSNNKLFMYSNKRIHDLYLSNFNLLIDDNVKLNRIILLLNCCRFIRNQKLYDLLLARIKQVNKGSANLTSLLYMFEPPVFLGNNRLS